MYSADAYRLSVGSAKGGDEIYSMVTTTRCRTD